MSSINDIVDKVRQATDYQTNKRILREKITSDLHIPYHGGLFMTSMELIAFLNSWQDNEIFIEDVYGNPIKVDRIELLDLTKAHYQSVMNEWNIEHEKLKRIRKV